MFAKERLVPIDLTSRDKIAEAAQGLIKYLKVSRLESRGQEWTDHNFSRLRAYFEGNTHITCHHKARAGFQDEPHEFMWDFLAISSIGGIVLAAESEQDHRKGQDLKHDFEKLLYVFSPLRLFISKAKSVDEAEALAASLSQYAKGCCLHFNPGSAFVLHFDLWNTGSIAFLWQSDGEPAKLGSETVSFVKQATE